MGEVVTTIPTIGFNVEQVTYKNLKFQVWDLGGQTSIRPYWRCYYSNTDAVIYVVDSADRDRIGISKQELVSMLEVSLIPWPCGQTSLDRNLEMSKISKKSCESLLNSVDLTLFDGFFDAKT